jgi:nucleotide-binding universal stress UspA family protein
MTVRSVLAVLASGHCLQDLENAVDFCHAAEAHLTALLVSMDSPPPIGSHQTVSSAWFRQQHELVDVLSADATSMKESLSASGLSFDLKDIYTDAGHVEEEVAERALYNDIVLIGREAALDLKLQDRIIAGALFRSPTPILLNRSPRPTSIRPGVVMVAWDSSDEAIRAVRRSMPFLRTADIVVVAAVDPEAQISANGREPGSDIARYLRRQGVRVQVDLLEGNGRRVEDILCEHARDLNADLIVMGAFGHSRIRERLFGGVTRSMIERAESPLFLCH